MSIRAAVYLRQSLDRDGNELAVSRQREDCLRLCAEKGWEPVEFMENDTSASKGKRKVYTAMLKDVRDAKVQAVVAYDLDRLHRQPRELEDFIDLADEYRLKLATVSGDVNLANDQGRLIARIKGVVARQEIERKSARQKRAHQQRAEAGKRHWPYRPFGYNMDGTLHPIEAPAVREAYVSILAGNTLTGVCKDWNERGLLSARGSKWAFSTLSLFLRNPRNAALSSHGRGNVVAVGADWEPIIDEATWRAYLAASDAKRTKRGRAMRRYLLTGLLTCGKCGSRMRGSWSRAGVNDYRCVKAGNDRACGSLSANLAGVEEVVLGVTVARLARADAAALLLDDERPDLDALQDQANTVRARMDELAADWVDLGMSTAQFKTANSKLRDNLAAIESQMSDVMRVRIFDGLPLGTAAVVEAFNELPDDRKRGVIECLLSVTIVPGRPIWDTETNKATFNPERVQIEWKP